MALRLLRIFDGSRTVILTTPGKSGIYSCILQPSSIKMLTLVTLKVNDQLKRRMRKFRCINWSEIARRAIEGRLEMEERLKNEEIDARTLDRAIAVQDAIRARSSGKWSLSKEINHWRRQREDSRRRFCRGKEVR